MAFLFLKRSRKNGIKKWYIIDRTLPPDRQWIPLGLDRVEIDRARANQVLDRYRIDSTYLRLELPIAVEPTTFSQLAVVYLEWRRGRVKEKTRDDERKQFLVIEKKFGERRIDSITSSEMKNYLLERGLKPNSLRLAVQALRNLFKFAIAEKYLVGEDGRPPANPMLQVPRPRIPKSIPKAIDMATVLQIIRALGGRRRLYFALMTLTAMRPGEAAKLRVSDGHPDGIHLESTKNSEERVIPWTPEIRKVWDELAGGLGSKDYLFPGKKGGHQKRWHKGLKGAIDRAGVAHVTPHRFRHTCATEVLRKKGNLRTVQILLGHRSISTTEIYTKVLQQDLEIAVADTFSGLDLT